MRAQASGTCQLFYDLGRGFNEEDSIKRKFSAETDALLTFPLPPGVISKLRFDPTDQLGWVRLNSARVLQGGRQEVEISLGNALLTNDVGETRLEEGSLRLHVLNRDPWVVLPMHGALEVRREWRVLFLFLTIAVAGTLTFAYLALRYARGGAGVVGGRSIAVYLGILALLALSRWPVLAWPLLEAHDFRQTQTALTAYWMSEEKWGLPAYPLPVLGYPWSVPMEFPTFQIVASYARELGLPMDTSVRSVALLSFAISVCTALGFLTKAINSFPARVAFIVLSICSPFSLVWSKASLIEYTAVSLGLIYVTIAHGLVRGEVNILKFAAISLVGVLAALTKITSFPVYWVPVGMLSALDLWRKKRDVGEWRQVGFRPFFLWIFVLLAPLVAVYIWTHLSDGIKTGSVFTTWLRSEALQGWNFGSGAQRVKWSNWIVIIERVNVQLLAWCFPLVALGTLYLGKISVEYRIVLVGMLIGSIATVLVFFNLYVVHDYYLCAIAIPLWLIASLGVAFVFDNIRASFSAVAAILWLAVPFGVSICTSPLVRRSYSKADYSHIQDPAWQIADLTPRSEEILIFGEDWNPRVPYYAKRKALMVRDSSVFAHAKEYAMRKRLRYVLAMGHSRIDVERLWSGQLNLERQGNGYAIYSIVHP